MTPARCAEPLRYSAALREQNIQRKGQSPDFAPAVPPTQAAWYARRNRDEAILDSRAAAPGTYQRPATRTALPLHASIALDPLANRIGDAPETPAPAPSPTNGFVVAYRVVASLPRGLTLDLLA